MPAEVATGEVNSILAARGVDGGLLSSVLQGSAVQLESKAAAKAAAAGGSGGGEGVLSLLQHAARVGNEKGATEADDEQRTEKAYQKLARLVPALMGGRGRLAA